MQIRYVRRYEVGSTFFAENISDTGDNGNDVSKKTLNFKDTRHKIFVLFAMSINLGKKSSKLKKTKQNKTIPGKIFGQNRPEKN